MKRSCIMLVLALLAWTSSALAGVTIHFEGIAANPEAVDSILRTACEDAKSRGWTCQNLSGELLKSDPVTLSMLREIPGGDDLAAARGVTIQPSAMCEPLVLAFTKALRTKNFTKTQFAGADIHIGVVDLLTRLQPMFSSFTVHDEGRYWDSHDRSALEREIEATTLLIAEIRKKKPGITGPITIAGGRIVDLVTPGMRLGSFTIDWPERFKREQTSQGIKMLSGAGETVLISPAFPSDTERASKIKETLSSFARDKLPELASKNGVVVQSLKKTELSEGAFYYNTASQGSKLFKDYYYLQYVLVGNRGGALFTIEGYGKAEEKLAEFNQAFDSAREAANTAAKADAAR